MYHYNCREENPHAIIVIEELNIEMNFLPSNGQAS